MSLVSLPELSCPPAFETGGVKSIQIFRTRDVFQLPACCGTQISSQAILLNSGANVYSIQFDDESVQYRYPHQRTEHGAYLQHEIAATRKGLTPEIDRYLAILPHDHWIIAAVMEDGRNRVIGSLTYPLRFLGAGNYLPGRDSTPFSDWKFSGVSRHPFCFMDEMAVLVIGCESLTASDFIVSNWAFNPSGDFIGIPAPQPTPGRLVASITSYDDGTVQQLSGGAFADTITHYTSPNNYYEPDGGPATLTPGLYRATMPMSVTLVDGTNCGFLLTQDFTVPDPGTAGIFDPTAFDPTIFE